MYGGQMSKNVRYVQNIFIRMILCVLACSSEFYMFILIEIDVGWS